MSPAYAAAAASLHTAIVNGWLGIERSSAGLRITLRTGETLLPFEVPDRAGNDHLIGDVEPIDHDHRDLELGQIAGQQRRGRGLGRRAFELLRRDASPADRRMLVEALVSNTAGVAFWESVGFTQRYVGLQLAPATQGR